MRIFDWWQPNPVVFTANTTNTANNIKQIQQIQQLFFYLVATQSRSLCCRAIRQPEHRDESNDNDDNNDDSDDDDTTFQ